MITFSGRRASQNEFELKSFIGFLVSHGVKKYLEIGARHGDTFHEIMINLPAGSFGVAVDLPGGLWGRQKTDRSLIAAVLDLRSKGYDVHYVIGNSQNKKIIDKVKSFGKFNAALIDGDHTLEGVSKDWENYQDVADLVAFHDIVGTGQFEKVQKNMVEVPILWQQIKTNHKTVEFIDDDSRMGIGVCLR